LGSFGPGEAGADRGAAARSGIDLQFSAGQRDALLHAEQSLALALGGASQSCARVESLAVVAHRQEERTVARGKFDVHLSRLRVAGDIGERLLHQAEAGGLERDGQARQVGDFEARLEAERAPRTCARFSAMLPLKTRLVQARWSGESAWIPLGDLEVDLGYENHTSYPAPGQLLFYPGGFSETEILFPYGATVFASKMGQLAGNHFATIEDGADQLAALGKLVLWEGAQEITFEAI